MFLKQQKVCVHQELFNCCFSQYGSNVFRFPNVSCELLTSDVSRINDKLGEDESLLTKLYSFLQRAPPLNPLLASFFSKVLSILISRKPGQVSVLKAQVKFYLQYILRMRSAC